MHLRNVLRRAPTIRQWLAMLLGAFIAPAARKRLEKRSDCSRNAHIWTRALTDRVDPWHLVTGMLNDDLIAAFSRHAAASAT